MYIAECVGFFPSQAMSVKICSSKTLTQVAALCWELKDVT